MNLIIPINSLRAARKLLTRIRFERLKLPVLTHVLATIDAAGLSLAVTDLDHWLEIRIPAALPSHAPTSFLIPAAALAAAARGDRGSSVRIDCGGDPEKPTLRLTVPCG
jgi:DNA polymerase III sliding clamp (beta) subunit (PCNA family)